ncbi:hypothetical protein G9C85_14220 [Halorubellus sp. JP-L1]|uniref:hypothetical protein n=1 Tax=Halorubellus sp. JP-L1 TaxID=2715753 RepID=UPI00140CB204|nr:hypothetical protein [Halorubellus sp. JP-L1]NHN42777.1 hypothetical protein [Halorubellus sp. JP-L1]
MIPIAYVPLALALLGGLLSLVDPVPETVVLGLLFGYFAGKLVQSVVWTVNGPRTAA